MVDLRILYLRAVWGSWRSQCCDNRWWTWCRPWRPEPQACTGADGATGWTCKHTEEVRAKWKMLVFAAKWQVPFTKICYEFKVKDKPCELIPLTKRLNMQVAVIGLNWSCPPAQWGVKVVNMVHWNTADTAHVLWFPVLSAAFSLIKHANILAFPFAYIAFIHPCFSLACGEYASRG